MFDELEGLTDSQINDMTIGENFDIPTGYIEQNQFWEYVEMSFYLRWVPNHPKWKKFELAPKILKMRYIEDMTLDEIGRAIGLSRERVRGIEAWALRILRHPTRRELFKLYLAESKAFDCESVTRAYYDAKRKEDEKKIQEKHRAERARQEKELTLVIPFQRVTIFYIPHK